MPSAWESCEASYGKCKTTYNLVNHFNSDRHRALKGLDIDVNPDPSTVTGGKNPGSIISHIISNEEEQTEALLLAS